MTYCFRWEGASAVKVFFAVGFLVRASDSSLGILSNGTLGGSLCLRHSPDDFASAIILRPAAVIRPARIIRSARALFSCDHVLPDVRGVNFRT